jgi:hypothetical protein
MPIFSFEAESYNTGAHFRIIAKTKEEALVRLREFFSWALKGCKDLTPNNIGEENGEFGQGHQFDSSHFADGPVSQSSGWPPTITTQEGTVYMPGISSPIVFDILIPTGDLTLIGADGEPI